MIEAEMPFEAQEEKFHPVDIKLIREKTSLTVSISSKVSGGSSGPEKLCSFYEDFEKGVKRAQTGSQPKQIAAPVALSKKPPEPDKESAPPASATPLSVASPQPSSPASPSPSPPPKASLPQAEVKWAAVNLREGPGTDRKLLLKVNKGTPLTILEEQKGWLHIRLEDGKEAWLVKDATYEKAKTSPPSTSPRTPSPSTAPETPKPKSPM